MVYVPNLNPALSNHTSNEQNETHNELICPNKYSLDNNRETAQSVRKSTVKKKV